MQTTITIERVKRAAGWRTTPHGTSVLVNKEGADIGHVYAAQGAWMADPWGREKRVFPTAAEGRTYIDGVFGIAPDCLSPAAQFFYKYAGYSYDPKTETEAQGHARTAIELAAAEELYLNAHRVEDVVCLWEADEDCEPSYAGVQTMEWVGIFHMDGKGVRACLASLSGIEDADDDCRRVIRAELAMQCADLLTQIVTSHRPNSRR